MFHPCLKWEGVPGDDCKQEAQDMWKLMQQLGYQGGFEEPKPWLLETNFFQTSHTFILLRSCVEFYLLLNELFQLQRGGRGT